MKRHKSMSARFRVEHYCGYVIGFSWRRRKYLFDALTARAIRKGKP